MALFRVISFNIILYVWMLFFSVTISILLATMPHAVLVWYSNAFFEGVKLIEKYILGLTFELLHRKRIPKGCYILAIKHQSVWETFKLYELAYDPTVVYKKELGWVPFFGWILLRMRMISVNRRKGGSALASMLVQAKALVEQKRPLVIFPQGTRVPIGEKRPYKHGIAALYQAMNVPVVPVALNAGYFWPKKGFMKKGGKVTMSVLPIIKPGLSKEEFLKKLENAIEKESDRLAKKVMH